MSAIASLFGWLPIVPRALCVGVLGIVMLIVLIRLIKLILDIIPFA